MVLQGCKKIQRGLAVGTGSSDSVVDHLLQVSSAGSFVLSDVVGPCFLDVQLTAQHLGQVLVGDVSQLGADFSSIAGQGDHVVVSGQVVDNIVNEGVDHACSVVVSSSVLFGSPVVGVVDGLGNCGPPVVVGEVNLVLGAGEQVGEPNVLAAAILIAVSNVDGVPVVGALSSIELVVGGVVQQILTCSACQVLNQVQNAVGVLAGGGDEVVSADPGTGGVGGTVGTVVSQSNALSQVSDGALTAPPPS